MRLGRASPPLPSEHHTDATDSGSSPPAPTDPAATCYYLEPIATATGETRGGDWPWPDLLTALGGVNRGVRAPCGPRDGPNTDGLWPTPTTHDQRTNYAQGGVSLGFAARTPEKFPTPRAEDSESTGAHRGVPDTLTSYTKVRPTPESFPTPTVYDATGHGSPRAEQKDGSRHAVSLHHMASMWPTPTRGMYKQDVEDSGQYARTVQDSGFQVTLAAAVKLRTLTEQETLATTLIETVEDVGQTQDSSNPPNDADATRTWPTPRVAGSNRTSRQSLLNMQGHRSGKSGLGLEQAVEFSVGIVPVELQDVDPNTLPPAIQTQWPTPMAGSNRTSHKAQSERPTSGPSRGGASFGLEDAVNMAELGSGHWPRAKQYNNTDNNGTFSTAVVGQQMFPTPTASDGAGGPGIGENSKGGLNLRTVIHEWATPTAATNRKSRRALTASKENGRRSGGGQSSPPALEQMVELAEGIIPKELEGIDPMNLPPATQAMWPTPRSSNASIYIESDETLSKRGRNGLDTLAGAVAKRDRVEPDVGSDNIPPTLGTHTNWPTPRARDWKGTDPTRDENRSGFRHSGDDLATAVDKRTWPTPLAGNPDSGSGGNHGGMALLDAARNADVYDTESASKGDTEIISGESFGTPTSSMKVRSMDFAEGRAPNPAEAAFIESGTRGQLNPDWVEWLMGWPVGWTSKEPLPVENMAAWYDQTAQATWWLQEPKGIPRIAIGVPNRVARLKAIGNGQVSLCAAWAALALFETERQVRDAEWAVVAGPLDVDFFDLVDGV